MVRKAEFGDIYQVQCSRPQAQIDGYIHSYHRGVQVFRMPPNCLKAFLLKRNDGVFPGTTSTESHNLFFPD